MGIVDARHFFIGDVDEFLGHALGDQPVGMIFTDKVAIGFLQRFVGDIGRDAQHLVRVGDAFAKMGGGNAFEGLPVESENFCDLFQVSDFLRANPAIGAGDVEKSAEKVFEDGAVMGEQNGDLMGIWLEPGRFFPRPVEQHAHLRLGGFRHPKNFLKGADFVFCDDAVRLCHLGGQYDDGGRKGGLAGGGRVLALGARIRLRPVIGMACDRTENGTKRSAKGQPCRPSD